MSKSYTRFLFGIYVSYFVLGFAFITSWFLYCLYIYIYCLHMAPRLLPFDEIHINDLDQFVSYDGIYFYQTRSFFFIFHFVISAFGSATQLARWSLSLKMMFQRFTQMEYIHEGNSVMDFFFSFHETLSLVKVRVCIIQVKLPSTLSF